MIALQRSVNSRLVFQLVFEVVFQVGQSMVSRQSNLYNYTPLARSLWSRVSFIYRVFVRHVCDHARSIFSLFLISHLPNYTCPQPVLSYIVPARSSHHGQQCYHRFNGNHSSGNPLHRYLAPNMDSLRAYQPFKYWIYTRHLLINWNLVCGMDWSHHVHTQVTT